MVYSEKLKQFKDVVHGFTTRMEGDFRRLRGLESSNRMLSQMKTAVNIFDMEELILPEQIHGSKITLIDTKDKGKKIKGADGLITKEKRVVLGVTTADCLPVLFFEPEERIVAVAHAGWEGTLKRVCQKVVERIKDLKGNPAEIVVAVGPHIKSCCYDIDEKRALEFKKEFGQEVVIKENGQSFLDLTKVNLIQLSKSGIKEKNIEVLPFCTFCSGSQFFSYRKDKENYGEMLSFIGIKKF